MATKNIIAEVINASKDARQFSEEELQKKLASLNGRDGSPLKAEEELWLLPVLLPSWKWKGIEGEYPALPAINQNGHLVVIGLGSLAGGSGYLEDPGEGTWEISETGWWYLKPSEVPEGGSRATKVWGLSRSLKDSFNDNLELRGVVSLKVEEDGYCYGPRLVKAGSPDEGRERASLRFKRNTHFWEGKAQPITAIPSKLKKFAEKLGLPMEWLKPFPADFYC